MREELVDESEPAGLDDPLRVGLKPTGRARSILASMYVFFNWSLMLTCVITV